MTTNLKSIAGADFDDLFEAGTGNQLLKIYGMDGQDIGQKYLNVSQGSQVSANTGFQASDSADVKTKLCGKGTNKISYKIWEEIITESQYVIWITVSGMPSGNSLAVSGNIQISLTFTDSEGQDSYKSVTAKINKTITSNGTVYLYAYPAGSGYQLDGDVKQGQVLTLRYMGKTAAINNFLYGATTSHQGTI